MIRAIEPKFVGKVWPNGKFGVSRVREAPFLSEFKSQPETEESQFRRNAIAVHGLMAVAKFEGKADSLRCPDLSNVSNSPIVKKRGQKGITRHGRNLISSAAVVAEKRYGRKLLTFGTVTLPSAPVEALRSLSANWSTVVKKFVKNLTRGLQVATLPAFVFGVTEVQEKRLERTGVPALHLHFVFVGRNSEKSAWLVSRKDVRRWWIQAIAPFLPPGTNFSSVENVQGVKKSAAAYLGKYMSKGASAIALLVERGLEEWIPSAWYTITHDFRRVVLSKVCRGEAVGDWLNWMVHNSGAIFARWIQPVMAINKAGDRFGVGYCGTLLPAGLSAVEFVASWNREKSSN